MAANPFAEFAAPPTQAANPFAQFAVPPTTPPAPSESGVPGPRQAGGLTGFARGLASLADVTVGGVLPTFAQQVVYPVARVLRTPEEATALTHGIVSAADRPFGKAFGVTGTPEYEQEASRRLMSFIGENFQKGADWISRQTGVPAADVENMIGTLTIAAPTVARPVARAVKEVGAPTVERAITAVKMPFEKQIQARRERLSAEDYARGPQIDAAAQAQRLGIALNPVDVEPSRGAKLTSMAAGPRGPEALAAANKGQVRKVALNELGLPETTQLNNPEAFNTARAQVAAPYDEVAKLPTMTADDTVRGALDRLRPDQSLIGSDKYAAAVNSIVDDALAKTEAGLTGAQLLDNVKMLRQRARKVYNNKNADLAALDVADTNLAVANALESMIESNISNPKLLDQFRDARQKMARTYAYEGATDLNTGMVDVKKLSRITSKDNTLTGDIAALGQIAGNFPDVFSTKATSTWYSAPRLSRSGAAGGLGALVGSQFGLTGSILGGALGGAAGEGIGALAARRMASPEYQAGLTLRDMRLPVNQLAATMPPIPQNQALVPYQAPVEVLGPNEGPYRPNFVFAQQPNQPRVTPVLPEANRLLGAPSPESTINALRAEDVRRAGVSRAVGQEAEAQQAAAEAAARRPTSGEVILDINPLTGAPEVSKGLKGATPETFQNFGESLAAAAEKITAGKAFDMTAAEKVAWNKTKADIAQLEPGFDKLSRDEIATKIKDRRWVDRTIRNARAEAENIGRQEAMLREQLANRDNLRMLAGEISAKNKQLDKIVADKARMLEFAEQMEEGLRAPRPVSTGGQGPKTRAFQRNRLNPDQDVLNQLLGK